MFVAFYKGTRPGLKGLYNRFVRWWSRGQYSHCELVFSDGMSASSSFEDGGVRFKRIDFDPARWDIVPVYCDEVAARSWFVARIGAKYDVLGNIRFMVGPMRDGKDSFFCSEAVAAAIGLQDSWRFDPNTLAAVLKSNI